MTYEFSNAHKNTQCVFKITGGRVCDPANHTTGTVADILINDSCIVDQLPQDVQPTQIRRINAAGCVIMPGGIDIHTHIAMPVIDSPAPNELDPPIVDDDWPLPSTALAAAQYTAMGYTTAIEAAVAPCQIEPARRQLLQANNLDVGYLIELGNHEPIIELLDQGDERAALTTVTDLLRTTGAYGIKLVNPGHALHCLRTNRYEEFTSVDQTLTDTRVTPRRIMQLMASATESLGLPHGPHLHCHRLGLPGNIEATLEALGAFEGRRVHLAHAQFHAYGQTPAGEYASAAQPLCDYLDQHPHVTLDVGQIVFGTAWVVTEDIALRHRLEDSPQTPSQLQNAQYNPPLRFTYRPDDSVHSLQWAIGLEIVLTCRNLWQIALSVDHPNGGPFWAYPQIIAWLMNKSLRDEQLAAIHPNAAAQSNLKQIDRELTLEEIAIITRAGPARALGLDNKGHLGTGADADIAIYADHQADAQRMFANARHVIKSGQVVMEDGQLCDIISAQFLPAPVRYSSA